MDVEDTVTIIVKYLSYEYSRLLYQFTIWCRMDCVQWLAQRLVRFVTVFEAEEKIYLPLLSGITAFLTQVFQTMQG
jgi:hypothetical protein